MDYDGGGLYVSENTWLWDFRPERRLVDLDYSIAPDSLDGYVILRAGR